jgi:CBS domain-containing protein
MNAMFKKIAVKNLSEQCQLASPVPDYDHYDLDSPAISLMVDFNKTPAITVAASLTVNDALELMRTNKIRALMVLDSRGNFVGVVTAMDLMGRKPMAYANEAGISRVEVQVKDIMSPKSKLKAMARADVERSTLADVVRVLKSLNEQHILVVKEAAEGMKISGLFSASDFKRALNIQIDTAKIANTFMDLERVINENKEVM